MLVSHSARHLPNPNTYTQFVYSRGHLGFNQLYQRVQDIGSIAEKKGDRMYSVGSNDAHAPAKISKLTHNL